MYEFYPFKLSLTCHFHYKTDVFELLWLFKDQLMQISSFVINRMWPAITSICPHSARQVIIWIEFETPRLEGILNYKTNSEMQKCKNSSALFNGIIHFIVRSKFRTFSKSELVISDKL
jgi:hypothetical protein